MKKILKSFYSVLDRATSIRSKLLITYIAIIIFMLVPMIMNIYYTQSLQSQYDKLIGSINYANNLNLIVKHDMNAEISDIVSGKKSFQEGKQYEILRGIENGLDVLQNSASTEENRQIVAVVRRTIDTQSYYVYRLGDQIRAGAKVAENEVVLEEIREISSLAYDLLQEYTFNEIQSVGMVNENLADSAKLMAIIQFVVLAIVVVFAALALLSLSMNIKENIDILKRFASEIAGGNLEARADPSGLAELTELVDRLNIMANQISVLIENNTTEQKHRRKSEMQALQAQIKPHFLYNSFETIVWLAQAERNKEVINVTLALSNFFRISLNQGMEWVSVEKEVEHVKSYLTIQKVRYGNILDYSIDVDSDMLDGMILKLLLQPLVENAIYHGIKNLRRQGHISVVGRLTDGYMHFSVKDNGVGMDEEQLASIRHHVRDGSSSSYGMYNVNKRIKLYYAEADDIAIESEFEKGTTVSFSLPFNRCVTTNGIVEEI